MLCRSNPAQASAVLNELLAADVASFDDCVDRAGSRAGVEPDGTPIINPCRQIIEESLPPLSEPRRDVIQAKVYEKFFNTNYTASWLFVRTSPSLDADGNFKSKMAGCPANHLAAASTKGPLRLSLLDSSQTPSSTIPLLADGAWSDTLKMQLGSLPPAALLTQPFTRGPVHKTTLEPPQFSAGKPRNGPGGWWEVWDKKVLQDYRGFAPVHKNACNVLMADGSVQQFTDANKDGLLNNGFDASPESGFADDSIELEPSVMFSKASIRRL
jgi:prepilin-type processing-associated H-X9-DG protein